MAGEASGDVPKCPVRGISLRFRWCGHRRCNARRTAAELSVPLTAGLRAVGKPKDGDPRVSFAVLELDDRRGLGVDRARDLRRERRSREVVAAGLPTEYAERLLIAA